ncbi:hypothetical protein YC2023_060414 [Brassica napus]
MRGRRSSHGREKEELASRCSHTYMKFAHGYVIHCFFSASQRARFRSNNNPHPMLLMKRSRPTSPSRICSSLTLIRINYHEFSRTGNITFRDIIVEADKFFHGRYIDKETDLKIANKTILNVSSDVDPSGVYTQDKSYLEAGNYHCTCSTCFRLKHF